MSRKPRIHYLGALYHAICDAMPEGISFDAEDRAGFYPLLQAMVERQGCRVHAFYLMTNHVSLIMPVGDLPLSRIVHGLAFRCTRWANRRQDRVGQLFQGCSRAILVDAEPCLPGLVRYSSPQPGAGVSRQ